MEENNDRYTKPLGFLSLSTSYPTPSFSFSESETPIARALKVAPRKRSPALKNVP
jgi:hypothetical protein